MSDVIKRGRLVTGVIGNRRLCKKNVVIIIIIIIIIIIMFMKV